MSSVKAFVLGYTGETGKALVKQLANDEFFGKVVLIGRRKVELDLSNATKFDQKVINFDEVEQHREAFNDCEVGFCCIGTTRKQGGADHFVKVDRDYVANSARAAKEAGCKHFQVVTATGANKDSFFLYNKTKGEVEELLKQVEFQRLSIFRPAFLLGNRVESRPFEKCLSVLFLPLTKMFPRESSVHFDTLAKAMIENAKTQKPADSVETIDNRTIHSIASDGGKK